MSTSTRVMTFAEFEKLPDAPEKQELLDGVLIEMPPAMLPHMKISTRFFLFLHRIVTQSEVMYETGFRIGGGWLQPDVSVFWPGQETLNGYAARSPMIAVEIVSPSNAAAYINRKVICYLQDGAGEVWVVYPETRSMMVHLPADMSARLYTGTYECALLSTTIPIDELIGQ
jgi:Uma2 family endonuclease